MTRAFRLRNASGDMIDLLADLDIFGVSPEGLGVSFDHTSHLSNSNYLLEKSELNQNEFKLSVALGYLSHDPYNAYYRLVQFLDKAPYILEYETTAGTWQREVRLKELSKTEIVSGDIMLEDFTLACFSPWYRNIESKYDPTEDTPGDGKIYIEYKSTALLKKIYAFSYSADGTEGFTTDYPQDNMIEEVMPFDRSKQLNFKTNDTANSSWTVDSQKVTMTNGAASKWTQFVLYSNNTGGVEPVANLNNITAGNVYTMSGVFTPVTDVADNFIINIVMSYVDQNNATVNLSSKNVRGTSLKRGVPYNYSDTTNVIPEDIANAKVIRISVTFLGIGSMELSYIKLELGDKATGATGLPNIDKPNLFADFLPFNTKGHFTFANGGDTTSKSVWGTDTLTISGESTSTGRAFIAFSHPNLWPGANKTPVVPLQNLKTGEQYTFSARFKMTTEPTADNTIRLQVIMYKQSGSSVYLLRQEVNGAKLSKDQGYYLNGLSIPIPDNLYDDIKSVIIKPVFDGPGTCVIDQLTMYEGDERFANNGFPTYIGEREVPKDYSTNVNLVDKGDLRLYTDSSNTATVSFDSWLGDGQFILTRTKGNNSGIYLMNKNAIKRNVEYTLHLEFRDSVYGLRNFLLYNPFNGDYTSSITVDGESVKTGFGKYGSATGGSNVYWIADQNNPEVVDKKWHTAEVTFNLSDTATIESVYGIIFQPDKALPTRPNRIEVKHVMLTEGPYPGYYTQEERPEFYQWLPISGKWEPPTPDGRDYNLTYDNEIFDYDYYQAPATRGPGMHAYNYDYIYEGWTNGANGVFRIENNSIYMGTQQGSPVEIYIDGPSKNPYWEVVRNGVILASDGFNLTIGEGYRLVVSSVPGEQRAELIAPDGTKSNVYQQQRLDLTNFVKIPTGYSQVIFHNAKYVSFNMREEKVVV